MDTVINIYNSLRALYRTWKMAAKPEGQVVKLTSCFSGLVDRQSSAIGQFTDTQEYREAWQASICSNSSGITVANWPKLAHSKGRMKDHVRAGVSPAVRKDLWMLMSEVTDTDSVLFAKAFGEPADGIVQHYECKLHG